MPKKFFVDSQKNDLHPNTLIYYVKHKRLMKAQETGIGFRFFPRPAEEREVDLEDRENLVYYRAAEYRMTPDMIADVLRPNETVYVDVELKRRVDKQVFRLDAASEPRVNFGRARPSGEEV